MQDNCIKLLNNNDINTLCLHNVESNPELLPSGYRTVPVLRINDMIFDGLLEPDEIRKWLRLEKMEQATNAYLERMLKQGKLDETRRYLERVPGRYSNLLDLLADPESSVSVKLGASALLEEKAGTDVLNQQLFPRLIELANHKDMSIRSDACFFLGLSNNELALPLLMEKEKDDSSDVREIAHEAVEQIQRALRSR